MIAVALLRRVYRGMLRLYPPAFRADYAAELFGVFDQAVREAARQGAWPALVVAFREFADWPINVLLEHAHQGRNKMKLPRRSDAEEIRLTRWIARTTSIFLIVLYSFVILLTVQPALFTLTIVAMSASLLLAWRWETIGGALTVGLALTCAFLVGLNALLTVPNLGFLMRILWGLGCMLGTLITWVSPHALIGWLFVSLGRHTPRPADLSPVHNGLSSSAA